MLAGQAADGGLVLDKHSLLKVRSSDRGSSPARRTAVQHSGTAMPLTENGRIRVSSITDLLHRPRSTALGLICIQEVSSNPLGSGPWLRLPLGSGPLSSASQNVNISQGSQMRHL